jgi:hypothetical protein
MRGSYVLTRLILFGIIGIEIVHFIINFSLASGGVNTNTEVSHGNTIAVYLIIIAIVVPLVLLRRLAHLGVSRAAYYKGILLSYTINAVIFSLFNIAWYYVEKNWLIDIKTYFNLITIFEWDRHGVIGMFLYQFFGYMFVISLLNLLFTSVWNKMGIIVWGVFAAVVSVTMSIGTLRNAVGDGIAYILYNPSLFMNTLLEGSLTLLLFLLGWWFVQKQQV